MNVIIDGTGKGSRAKVDADFRLHVDSVSRDQDQQSALKGTSFNINTGTITLTSANESGVFYITYTGDEAMIIKEILVIVGTTTGGGGDAEVKILRNPTAGTIVSNATNVETNANRDFSSSNQYPGVVYKGDEGNTLTGGTDFASTTRSSFGTVISFDASVIVLKKGNSLGVKYTPPAGNTSQTIKVAVTAFEETVEVVT